MKAGLVRWRDAVSLGWLGARSRPARAVMSGLGIGLGVATVVLVIGIPAEGQADLNRRLTALGSDVLVAQPAAADADRTVRFPAAAAALVRRIGPVTAASALANLNVPVVRDRLADPNDTAGITALAATPNLLPAVRGTLADGRFLDAASERLPTVVLGWQAARWLGITTIDPNRPLGIDVDGIRLAVIGVLAPMPLTPELAQAVFVGWDAARSLLRFGGRPSVVYLRTEQSQLDAVRAVLPPTLEPQLPGLVSVTRPSDLIAAREATRNTFAALFLGLAAVALAVGGIGVANTMVVSVLERRREIGLRRAIGAGRGDIRLQFLVEAVVLSLLGGLAGAALGLVGDVGWALARGWPVRLPLAAVAGGAATAIVIGALAGLYPAIRAARLAPTQALAM